MTQSSPVLSARREEVHWTKVLQANLIPPPGRKSLDGSPTKPSARSRGQNLQIPGKVKRKQKRVKRQLSASRGNKLTHPSNKGYQKTKHASNILGRLYNKVVQWISPNKKAHTDDEKSDASSTNCDLFPSAQDSSKTFHNSHEGSNSGLFSDFSECQNFYCLSYHEKGCRTCAHARVERRDSGFTSPTCLTGDSTPCTASEISLASNVDLGDQQNAIELASRTYSWPTTIRRKVIPGGVGYIDWDEDLINNTPGEVTGWKTEDDTQVDNHCDYSIPFSDLLLTECTKKATNHHIFRGKWHGDVIVHQFIDMNDDEMEPFWENLNQLSKIRHENIILFMGACVQLPNLAIVTSGHRGKSLYEHIHVDGESLPVQTKVNILRQVTRGLGYLHARGVVMGCLNSRNIILDTKVKLSLLDTSMAHSKYHRTGYATLTRGLLTYLPPELIRRLTVAPPCVQLNAQNEPEGDIFAFGTVLYEILCGVYPFCGQTVECIIYNVGKGHTQCPSHLKCSSRLKSLNKRCWSNNKNKRPTCVELNQTLNQNFGLHKKHSSSVPERVDQLTNGKIT